MSKELALKFAFEYGAVDGGHHKMWVIDQMVRALTDCSMEKRTAVDCTGKSYEYEAQGESEEYKQFVANHSIGEDGPNTYDWDEGIAP